VARESKPRRARGWAQRRHSEAETELKLVFEVEPSSTAVNRALATFHLSTDRAADAEQHLRAVATATPMTPTAQVCAAPVKAR